MYDPSNRLRVITPPKRVTLLEAGQRLAFGFPPSALQPGIYRVDLNWDGRPVCVCLSGSINNLGDASGRFFPETIRKSPANGIKHSLAGELSLGDYRPLSARNAIRSTTRQE